MQNTTTADPAKKGTDPNPVIINADRFQNGSDGWKAKGSHLDFRPKFAPVAFMVEEGPVQKTFRLSGPHVDDDGNYLGAEYEPADGDLDFPRKIVILID